jgi:hypothetical protein
MAQTLAEVARAANDTIAATRNLIKEAAGLAQPFADAVPLLDQAESRLGDIVKTAAKFQVLGPAVTIASFAIDRFGNSTEEAAGKSSTFDKILDGITESVNNLNNSLKNFQGAARPTDVGLNVQQVLNRVTGFDSAETRARIRGDTDEILSVLRDEQAFLEAQLERDFVKRRPALQRQLENALFGVVNDIGAISAAGAADAKRAGTEAARKAKEIADELARAIAEADRALLDTLSNRRNDAERRVAAAADTKGVADDIRRQNQLQALIKQQIQKIRERIRDEQQRKEAIRQLRIALIDSRREEEALREEQRKNALAERQAAIERRAQSLELDIELADINENDARSVALRRRRIAQLKKEAKLLKLEGNALKENRNERARIRKEIEEILKEEKEANRKSAQQLGFEFMQKQTGFVSNLLGNLIPAGQTAGLVGQAATPGSTVAQARAKAQAGQPGVVTSGQAQTTNEILRRILLELQQGNKDSSHPEAKYERKAGSASMDVR